MQNNMEFSQSASLLLVELGTEEIPARFLPEAIAKLRENGERLFAEYRLSVSTLKAYATPRRLTLLADVDPVQTAVEREVWGPPVSAAFDETGNPTKAAEAFAKAQGVPIDSLQRREKGKGAYIVASVKEEARPATDVLPEILTKLILSLNFPKSMRWGDSDFRFVRPIHWILSLYNNEKVVFEIRDLQSGSTTRGHRFLSPASFEIRDIRAYINLLRNNYVILDPEERVRMILEGSNRLAASVNAVLVQDDELLNHVSFLIEYPVPVLGTFPFEYLALPRELLITVMKGHQKYFALEDRYGKLSNSFIIVSNTKPDNAETVRRGAERVIKARFEDARFYFEEDRRVPLMERLEGLKKVIYHERLGSIHAKTLRIDSLAGFIAERCHPGRKEDIHTAALLTKTDLISGVVREFPELQGIMGGYYARLEGYKEDVARAVSEHYRPAFSGDKVPETDIGAVVSLADKCDNLASFFMLGLTPTGTEDPFALRRQALSSLAILIQRRLDISLEEILSKALEPYSIDNRDAIVDQLIAFIAQRAEHYFQSEGFPQDVVAAVMGHLRNRPLHRVIETLAALKTFREDPGCAPFLLVMKRVNNIAPREEMPEVSPALFVENEERVLWERLGMVKTGLPAAIASHDDKAAIDLLATLQEPVNLFFDKVLIMDKRDEVKRNRLSLLRQILDLSIQVADFSKLS